MRRSAFAATALGQQAQRAAAALGDGDVLLLENVRFHPGEESNDPEFAQQLADSADLYVNDAFGTAHRAHASTEGVAHLLPSVAGSLMEAELRHSARVLQIRSGRSSALSAARKSKTRSAFSIS